MSIPKTPIQPKNSTEKLDKNNTRRIPDGLRQMAKTIWEQTAIAHDKLCEWLDVSASTLQYWIKKGNWVAPHRKQAVRREPLIEAQERLKELEAENERLRDELAKLNVTPENIDYLLEATRKQMSRKIPDTDSVSALAQVHRELRETKLQQQEQARKTDGTSSVGVYLPAVVEEYITPDTPDDIDIDSDPDDSDSD